MRNVMPARSIKPLPHPAMPEAFAPPSQHLDSVPLAPALSVSVSSSRIAPQERSRQRDHGSRSSTRDEDMNQQALDTRLGDGSRSKTGLLCGEARIPPRPPLRRVILPSDRRLERGPAFSSDFTTQQPIKESASGRPGQRPTAESGADMARVRKRARQPTSTVAYSTAYDDSNKVLFACPYYKSNPYLHPGCRRYELKRVKDVRQHLSRKHNHCTSCYEVFDSPNSLKRHQRGAGLCKLRDPASNQISSISKQQRKKTGQQTPSLLDKKKSAEEQWVYLWNILFPETTRPRSIYLDSSLDEALSRLRAFWASNRSGIIKTTIQHIGPFPAHELDCTADSIFNQFVECFLSRFEAETAGLCSSADARTNTAPQSSPCDFPKPAWDGNTSTTSTAVGDPGPGMQFVDASQTSDPFLGCEYEQAWFSLSEHGIKPLQCSPISCPSATSLSEPSYGPNTPPLYDGSLDTVGLGSWIDEEIFPAMLTAPTDISQQPPMNGGLQPVSNRHTDEGAIQQA